MNSIRETIGQTAIRIVREWRDMKYASHAQRGADEWAEIEADHDLVVAWLLGREAQAKGGGKPRR